MAGAVQATLLQSLARSPLALAATVVCVLLVWWLMTRRAASRGSGGSNVLRPVRASERAMTKRGVSFRTLKIQDIEVLSPDTQRFRIALPSPSDSLGKRGHMSVQATIDGQRVVRPYTPITPPWQKGYFDLVIKRYDYGALTPYLFKLMVGDEVSVRGPFGGLKYESNEHDTLLMIGAGSGLTPLLQAIRIALNDPEDETRLVLLYQNRNESDILLREELERICGESPRLTVHFYCSRAPASWSQPHRCRFSGYITADVLAQLGLAEGRAGAGAGGAGAGTGSIKSVVCGPAGFNKAMKELLVGAGVDNVRLL